jgi:hypothetical protein
MRKSLPICCLEFAVAAILSASGQQVYSGSSPSQYTRLVQVPPPKIVAHAASYPGQYQVANLLDNDAQTEFASNGKGTNTFVELEFNEPTRLMGFRHVDRNDPATVATSELVFMDAGSNVVSTLPVEHVNERGGVTFVAFSSSRACKKGTLDRDASWRRAGGGWRSGVGVFYTGSHRGNATRSQLSSAGNSTARKGWGRTGAAAEGRD